MTQLHSANCELTGKRAYCTVTTPAHSAGSCSQVLDKEIAMIVELGKVSTETMGQPTGIVADPNPKPLKLRFTQSSF